MPKLLTDEEITQLCQHAAVCAQQIIDHTDRYTDANDLHKTVVKLAYTARVWQKIGRTLEKQSCSACPIVNNREFCPKYNYSIEPVLLCDDQVKKWAVKEIEKGEGAE
jgi:hypothetical protein